MGRKKRLQELPKEELEFIEERMRKPQKVSNDYEFKDDLKNKLKTTTYKLNVKCKNQKQKTFLKHLLDVDKKVNICNAPAGVGKSFLALYAGLECLKNGDIDKITIIVPTVEASEVCKIGLLPGTIDEKIEPYKIATISTLEKILKVSGNADYKFFIQHLLNNKMIDFDLLSYARGRNYDHTFLILDEAENLSKKECLLLMTRIGEGNSKIVLIGDEQQCDRKDLHSLENSGLKYAEQKLEGLDEVTIDKFTTEDIVRNEFLTKLLNAWNE